MHRGLLPAQMVRLTVRDTGIGIPPEIIPKIFDPFFTTKKQAEGTGLGLAIVHGVLGRCKGAISIETVEGLGTAFHVYLPLYGGSEEVPVENRRNVSDGQELSDRRRVRVFYVDDEFQVARLAQRYLSRLGLEVETEIDSSKALVTLRNRMGDFDVMVTDQTMPSVSGLELARQALLQNPTFPIILCTGYSEGVSQEMAKAAGIREYMSKPTDYSKMAEVIRACFQGGAQTDRGTR